MFLQVHFHAIEERINQIAFNVIPVYYVLEAVENGIQTNTGIYCLICFCSELR